jgi:hypothetical protein
MKGEGKEHHGYVVIFEKTVGGKGEGVRNYINL